MAPRQPGRSNVPLLPARVILAPGRERSLLQRHPWVFSGAIAQVLGDPAAGDPVSVLAADGEFLAVGAYSPQSQIRVRVWTFDAQVRIDAGFFTERVRLAVQRRSIVRRATSAVRLVNAESDGLPGLIVDRYADVLVVQILAAGVERFRAAVVDALCALEQPGAIYERSDAEVRSLEGLAPRSGLLHGALPAELVIEEHGVRYAVDVVHGQKTGFYIDQRDNRLWVRDRAAGREILNAFCYTGGFTLPALAGGASRVLSLDSSAEALALAGRNLALNGLAADRAEWRQADVFSELRKLRDQRAAFGAIVLDPPKFAPTAQHAAGAARAYKDINLLALKLLRPGGWLMTFSCSGGIDAELFRKIVAGAAVDAGVDAGIMRRLGAGEDHPVGLGFPEGEYLKGLLLQVG